MKQRQSELIFLLFLAGIIALSAMASTQAPIQLEHENAGAIPNAPVSPYKSMQVVGFNGDWSVSHSFGVLKNTYLHVWEGVERFPTGTHEFRFIADKSWSTTWGSSGATSTDLSGTAIFNGGNLTVQLPGPGRYYIRFNNQTGEYLFSTAATNVSPTANAGADVTVVRGEDVHFDGRGSFDPDGVISLYEWSFGQEGPTPVYRFYEEGVHDVVLTVYDNASPAASAQDTVRVTVLNETPHDPDLRRETIYNILVSRWNDGYPGNNFYNRERIARSDPHWRGDFQGIIDRLDYIKDLGFTAICLSPTMENRGALDYTGNYPYDWMTIDPRLESPNATYRHLIDAIHARGMKVFQTVVLNHCSNYGIRGHYWVDRLPHKFYRNSKEAIVWPYTFHWGNYQSRFREDNDNPKAPAWFQDYVHRDEWGKGPLTDPQTGKVLPLDLYNAERFFGTDEKLLDPNWFHQKGWYSASADGISSYSLHFKHLEKNMLDLATENGTVKSYLNKAVETYTYWGVDGIKIDFAGAIPRYDLLFMMNRWKEKKPHLFVYADVEGQGSALGKLGAEKYPSELAPWWYSRIGYNPTNPDSDGNSRLAVHDYTLFDQFKTSLVDGHFTGLGPILQWDYIYGDPTTLITFFHTFQSGPGTDRRYKFGLETWKAAIAYNLIYTNRGIPSIIAGEECEFQKGLPLQPIGTTDLLSATGRAYFGDKLTAANIGTTQNHDLYNHIKRWNLIRSRIPALQKGMLLEGNEWGGGMSFVRDFQAGESYAVIGLSAVSDQTITVQRVRNGMYADAITGATQTVTDHTLTFTVKAHSAGVWVLNGSGKMGVDGTFLR